VIIELENLVGQLRATMGKMETALGAISDAIVWINQDGKIQWCNSTFNRLINQPHIDVLGKELIPLLPLKQKGQLISKIDHPVQLSITEKIGRKDCYQFQTVEQFYHLEISWVPVQLAAQETCFVFVIHDVTEQKEADKRMNQLLEKLESTNQELQDFAHIVSHDLKAPLRAIASMVGMLTADYKSKFDESGKELLGLLETRTQRMHNLIDGILTYSKAGRNDEKKSEINLNNLLEEIIEFLAPPKHIKISLKNKLPTLWLEKTRIEQIFQNLLSNSVKFMDKPEGKIIVDCVSQDSFWKFSIFDNGPGIDEKHFEKIFKIFHTLHSKDTYESSGIGLTIAKKIVEMYDGKIWLESKRGEGTTFYFTLPK